MKNSGTIFLTFNVAVSTDDLTYILVAKETGAT